MKLFGRFGAYTCSGSRFKPAGLAFNTFPGSN